VGLRSFSAYDLDQWSKGAIRAISQTWSGHNAKLCKHKCTLDELAGYPVNTSVAWPTTTCSTHGSIHTQVT